MNPRKAGIRPNTKKGQFAPDFGGIVAGFLKNVVSAVLTVGYIALWTSPTWVPVLSVLMFLILILAIRHVFTKRNKLFPPKKTSSYAFTGAVVGAAVLAGIWLMYSLLVALNGQKTELFGLLVCVDAFALAGAIFGAAAGAILGVMRSKR